MNPDGRSMRNGDGTTDEVDGHPAGAAARMLATVTAVPTGLRPYAVLAIEACQDCAQACTACADACLGEESIDELTGCVRALLDAADVASLTARVLSRTGTDRAVRRALLAACWSAVRVAREHCQEHMSIHHHCAVCSRACVRAEQACRDLLERTT